MKKALIIIIFLSGFASARCDIIFFPLRYSLLSYSIESIVSYEKAINSRSTWNYWGGVGAVGSYLWMRIGPYYGAEIGIERRRYFKKDTYGLTPKRWTLS